MYCVLVFLCGPVRPMYVCSYTVSLSMEGSGFWPNPRPVLACTDRGLVLAIGNTVRCFPPRSLRPMGRDMVGASGHVPTAQHMPCAACLCRAVEHLLTCRCGLDCNASVGAVCPWQV